MPSERDEQANPELERFDKAVAQCRDYLRRNLGTLGEIRLRVVFEGGRIHFLEKAFSDSPPR